MGFAGIGPVRLRLYPVVSHIAEKLHAYTMPRARPNSRIKDLPDIALLASAGEIEASTLRTALEKTFEFRATHALPDDVPLPPTTWEAPYEAITTSAQLTWRNLGELVSVVRAFLQPVLTEPEFRGVWSPEGWNWE